MNRMLQFSIVTGLVLTAFSVSVAAPAQGSPNGTKTGKELYSTRPAQGKFVAPRSVPQSSMQHFMQQPRLADVTPEHTIVEQRRAPVPPAIPQRMERFEIISDEVLLMGPNGLGEETIISDRPLSEEKSASPSLSPEKALERPLSGIDIPGHAKATTISPSASPWKSAKPTVAASAPETKSGTETTASQKVETVYVRAEPAVSDLDQFNARLAKIQLEKKNLDETLALIEKIESATFKVKTLVDLAEYVSRDSNYKKEADRLYDLAVAGIDALSKGKPILVQKAPVVSKAEPESTDPNKAGISTTPKSVPKSAPKRALTLIDEEEEATPALSPPSKSPKSQAVVSKPVESQVESKPSAPKSDLKLELNDEPIDDLPKLDNKKEIQIKIPEEKKSGENARKRPALTLLDADDDLSPADKIPGDKKTDSVDKLENTLRMKAEEMTEPVVPPATRPDDTPAATPAPQRRRSSLILLDEPEEEKKPALDKAIPSKRQNSDNLGTLPVLPSIPKNDILRKDDSTSEAKSIVEKPTKSPGNDSEINNTESGGVEAESPKPKRRPMPSRRKITVEED